MVSIFHIYFQYHQLSIHLINVVLRAVLIRICKEVFVCIFYEVNITTEINLLYLKCVALLQCIYRSLSSKLEFRKFSRNVDSSLTRRQRRSSRHLIVQIITSGNIPPLPPAAVYIYTRANQRELS
jgi:hypothetical protein